MNTQKKTLIELFTKHLSFIFIVDKNSLTKVHFQMSGKMKTRGFPFKFMNIKIIIVILNAIQSR